MFVGTLDDNQAERLQKARVSGKYGHLLTWRELFTFQHTMATADQFHEIANWAARKNRGEKIRLPLALNVTQSHLTDELPKTGE